MLENPGFSVQTKAEMLKENVEGNLPQYQTQTDDETQELAILLNCELVKRLPAQLLLDLDSNTALETFRENIKLPFFREIVQSWFVTAWESRGGKVHVSLTCGREFTDQEANVLALFLGSDPRRGLWILKKLHDGLGLSDVLFRPLETKDLTTEVLLGNLRMND